MAANYQLQPPTTTPKN